MVTCLAVLAIQHALYNGCRYQPTYIVLHTQALLNQIVFVQEVGMHVCVCLPPDYRIRQNSQGVKLSRFLLNRESFPVEYFTRLGIYYYKKLLPRKFSRFIFALTAKVFPLDCFDVYGIKKYSCKIKSE